MNQEMYESIINFENLAPEDHPVRILMEEHRAFLKLSSKLTDAAVQLKESDDSADASAVIPTIIKLIDLIKDTQNHYLREENVLFSFLQKHGITGPPSIMWAEHDQIRACKKDIYGLINNRQEMEIIENASKLAELADTLTELLTLHFNKENKILFPMAMQNLSESEWQATIQQFAEIGYPAFTSGVKAASDSSAVDVEAHPAETGMIDLGAGELSKDELTAMLNSLPVDITFVDKDDTFRYFNQTKDPIFTRTKASIGLKVQNCHPAKSVHMVNKILDDFKSGARDDVAFWIDFKEKFVYIRYFAVRDAEGEYLGCMEVMQDIKDIKSISGEKRLLDS